MKKCISKIYLLILCAIVIVFPITIVFAGSTTGGESNGGYTTGWEYAFNGSSGNGYGLRMSLYNYDGSNLTYYKSVDFCTGGGCFEGQTAYVFGDMAGRIAYENGKATLTSNSNTKTLTVNPKRFSCYDDGCSYGGTVDQEILSFFGLSSSSDYNTVRANINNTFGTNIIDLSNIYITIEPTVFFYWCYNHVGGGDGEAGFYVDDNGNPTSCWARRFYYGTAYEFLVSGKHDDYSGMGRVLGKDIANSIKASIATANDYNCFIGTSNCSSSLVSLVSDNDSDKTSPLNGINNKKGYGINVIWLGNYVTECNITTTDNLNYNLNITGNTVGISYGISNIAGTINGQNTYKAQLADNKIYGTVKDSGGNVVATCEANRTVPTCSQTCSGTNDLLECVEDYCSQMSSDTSSKKSCISTCGYVEPTFSSCPDDSSKKGKDTVCSATTSASKSSCTEATLDTYYKIECTESSKIVFGDSLPTTLMPGASFKYNATLSGSKTCKVTFEIDKWLYDYAVSYTNEEREKLLDILEEYEMLSSSNNISKDSVYTYDSSDAKIILKISKNKNNEDAEEKELVVSKSTNLLSKDYEIDNGDTVSGFLYENGTKEEKNIIPYIEIKSSNKTEYQLPKICVDSKTNEVYEPTGDKCKVKEDGPYNEYFTLEEIENGKYNTFVNVIKDSSNLDVDNTCYYGVEKEEEIENPKTSDSVVMIITIGTIIALGIGAISYKKIFVK